MLSAGWVGQFGIDRQEMISLVYLGSVAGIVDKSKLNPRESDPASHEGFGAP